MSSESPLGANERLSFVSELLFVHQLAKEDVLDLAALVTERALKQRWLVGQSIVPVDVSNHAGLCGYEL
jgi:hypothetical protein